jgi:IrrE N-terminal-like domain
MGGEDRLERAARSFRAASSLAELRAAISTWAPRFHDSLNEQLRPGARPELGMDVATIPGRGALAARRGGSFFVGLGSRGDSRERRFTLAHELAHVLLNRDETGSLGIGGETEEDLCELFARRALAPPALVREYLDEAGFPIRLADINAFADRFRISLRASLVVLDEIFPARWPVAFAAASWREHPRGDGVMGMRIDVFAADRRFFLPIDCRLSTLGYSSLEAWALDGEVGVESRGRDAGLELRSWRKGVPGWVGEGEWTARRHFAPGSSAEEDERGVLCLLEVSGLSPRAPRRRRRAPAARLAPATSIAGQLPLSS